MNGVTGIVPVLAEGIQVLPFDSSSLDKRYLLVRRDGRRWHISEYLERVIGAIDGERDTDAIARLVSASLGREVLRSDIEGVLAGFLGENRIVGGADAEVAGAPLQVPYRHKNRSTTFRLRLLWGRPLGVVTGAMRWLFAGPVAWVLVCGMVAGQIAWCATHTTVMSVAMHTSWAEDVATVLGLVFVSLFLHEFGHAAACRAFGAQEGEIGFAVYLIFPVFYCDVTDAWKLTRRQRAALDMSGIYVQALFATAMLVAYLVSGKDYFLWTFLAISVSYAPNLNPFLKMDGYWFLSDMLGVENLSLRIGELLRGNHTTMRALPRKTTALVYLYLAATVAYMVFFFYWVGRYALVLASGAYMENVRVLMDAVHGQVYDWLPALLSVVTGSVVLVALPFLGWRTLRGCLSWMSDIASAVRARRAA